MTGKRSVVQGHGINDSQDKATKTQFYMTWKQMLRRAYSPEWHRRKPHYKGTLVCDDWLYFRSFERWMQSQDWEGKHLDKDIITPGNKIYSPEHCAFITNNLNNLMNKVSKAKGSSFHKESGMYRAQINRYGKLYQLGTYNTVEEASAAYRKAKTAYIREVANQQSDPRIADGLRKHADLLNPK